MKNSESKLKEILEQVSMIEKDGKHIIEYLMDFGSVSVCVKTSTN